MTILKIYLKKRKLLLLLILIYILYKIFNPCGCEMTMEELTEKLLNVNFAEFLFNIKPAQEIIFKKFKGATIRGGFGYSFKKLVCIFKEKKDCKNCCLTKNCVYSQLFESSSDEKRKFLEFEEIPRPFVIEPPYTSKTIYKENFPLKLILVGKAIKYFPYFFLSFQNLGKIGLGISRQTFTIKEVVQIYPERKNIYTDTEEFLSSIEIPEKKNSLYFKEKISDKIKLNFISPTRIKFQGKFISIPEFHHLVRNLIRRITFLSYYWCDYKIEYDWKNLTKEASDIKIENCKIKWVDLERYSSRQKTKMKMGGFVGNIEYKGSIEKFLPLIYLGSYLHIGKNTTFGLGKYIIENEQH